jgi:hypothetical protein
MGMQRARYERAVAPTAAFGPAPGATTWAYVARPQHRSYVVFWQEVASLAGDQPELLRMGS